MAGPMGRATFEIQIAGNTQQFERNISGLNTAFRKLLDEARHLEKALKLDPGNINTMLRQFNNLGEQFKVNRLNAQRLNEELDQLKQEGAVDTSRFRKLTEELERSERQAELLTLQLKKLGNDIILNVDDDELENAREAIRRLENDIDINIDVNDSEMERAQKTAKELDGQDINIDVKVKGGIDGLDKMFASLNSLGDSLFRTLGNAVENVVERAFDVLVDASRATATQVTKNMDAMAITANLALTKGWDTSAVEAAMQKIIQGSDDSGIAVSELAGSVTQLASIFDGDIGKATDTVLNTSTALAKLGINGQQAENAMRALNQSFGAGKLNAQDFNQLVAAGFDDLRQGVIAVKDEFPGLENLNMDNFKQAMADGKITTDVMVRALEHMANEFRATEGATVPFGLAVERLKQTWMNLVTALTENINFPLGNLLSDFADVLSRLRKDTDGPLFQNMQKGFDNLAKALQILLPDAAGFEGIIIGLSEAFSKIDFVSIVQNIIDFKDRIVELWQAFGPLIKEGLSWLVDHAPELIAFFGIMKGASIAKGAFDGISQLATSLGLINTATGAGSGAASVLGIGGAGLSLSVLGPMAILVAGLAARWDEISTSAKSWKDNLSPEALKGIENALNLVKDAAELAGIGIQSIFTTGQVVVEFVAAGSTAVIDLITGKINFEEFTYKTEQNFQKAGTTFQKFGVSVQETMGLSEDSIDKFGMAVITNASGATDETVKLFKELDTFINEGAFQALDSTQQEAYMRMVMNAGYTKEEVVSHFASMGIDVSKIVAKLPDDAEKANKEFVMSNTRAIDTTYDLFREFGMNVGKEAFVNLGSEQQIAYAEMLANSGQTVEQIQAFFKEMGISINQETWDSLVDNVEQANAKISESTAKVTEEVNNAWNNSGGQNIGKEAFEALSKNGQAAYLQLMKDSGMTREQIEAHFESVGVNIDNTYTQMKEKNQEAMMTMNQAQKDATDQTIMDYNRMSSTITTDVFQKMPLDQQASYAMMLEASGKTTEEMARLFQGMEMNIDQETFQKMSNDQQAAYARMLEAAGFSTQEIATYFASMGETITGEIFPGLENASKATMEAFKAASSTATVDTLNLFKEMGANIDAETFNKMEEDQRQAYTEMLLATGTSVADIQNKFGEGAKWISENYFNALNKKQKESYAQQLLETGSTVLEIKNKYGEGAQWISKNAFQKMTDDQKTAYLKQLVDTGSTVDEIKKKFGDMEQWVTKEVFEGMTDSQKREFIKQATEAGMTAEEIREKFGEEYAKLPEEMAKQSGPLAEEAGKAGAKAAEKAGNELKGWADAAKREWDNWTPAQKTAHLRIQETVQRDPNYRAGPGGPVYDTGGFRSAPIANLVNGISTLISGIQTLSETFSNILIPDISNLLVGGMSTSTMSTETNTTNQNITNNYNISGSDLNELELARKVTYYQKRGLAVTRYKEGEYDE